MGIVLILLAVAWVPFHYFMANSVQEIMGQMHADLKNTDTANKSEEFWKETALIISKSQLDLWDEYQNEKLLRMEFLLLFIAAWCIGFARREKIYKGLLKKLRGP